MSEERNLIGMILKTRDGFEGALSAGVTEDLFLDPVCRSIFKAVRSLDDEGKRPSLPNLAKALGPSMVDDLTAISSGASLTQNIRYYADEVVTAANLRKLQLAIREMTAAIVGRQPFEPMDLIEKKWAEFQATAFDFKSGQEGPRLLSDLLPGWLDDLEKRMTSKTSENIPTGFPAIDLLFQGGWHRGGFYVIAARPGRGKTTFALSSALESAFAGHKVLFATVEMNVIDITTKALSNVGDIKTGAFIKADLSQDELDRAAGSIRRVHNLPLWIDDSWQGRFERFASNCRRLKRKHGLEVAFLDYIGLAKLYERGVERKDEIAEISKRCKLLAMELQIAVVALAQLNRDSEKFNQPSKHHIADSDNLGRDPDGVLLLYRPKEDDGGDTAETWVSVAKNRWGKEVDFPVIDELAFSRFKPADLNLAAFE